MVLATQCLLQRRPKTLRIDVDGPAAARRVREGPHPGDHRAASAWTAARATSSSTRGEAVRALSMEQRMTVCNMSIEAGARAGLVAPDDTTFGYLAGRPGAPVDGAWDAAVARWRGLATDEGARFDRQVSFDCGALAPMITFGTNPGMGAAVDAPVPDPDVARRPARAAGAPARAGVHAGRAGQAAARHARRRGLHRQLHERAAVGPARRRGRLPRPARGAGRPGARRARARSR